MVMGRLEGTRVTSRLPSCHHDLSQQPFSLLGSSYLGYVHAGVVVDLGLLDDDVVLAVADVGDVAAVKVPGLDPVGQRDIAAKDRVKIYSVGTG